MNENRRLRKLHLKLIEQVCELFEIDLLKSKHIWKDKLSLIQNTIELGCKDKQV